MLTRGTGLILDPPELVSIELRDRHVARLVGADPAYAPARDWRDRLDVVPDQGASETCVAWLFSTAAYVAGQIQGAPIPRPSVRWIYACGSGWWTPGQGIDPAGRSIRATARQLARHGIIAEHRWPWDVTKVTDPNVPIDIDVAGADALLTGWYSAGGGDLPTQLRMALDKGHIPGIAINVRESFDAYRSGLYAPAGSSRGWHAIAVLGYTPTSFTVCANWGRSFGDEGFVHFPDAVIASPEVADAVVITAAPRGVR